jgi:hypothetical protein
LAGVSNIAAILTKHPGQSSSFREKNCCWLTFFIASWLNKIVLCAGDSMRRAFMALATMVIVAVTTLGQQEPVPETIFGGANTEPSGGTLNLILANRNGFVIAADSRRTASDGQHWDDSQKLFRVGRQSALVIAGFAAASAPGTPLDVQVSALLREHFGQLEQRRIGFDGQDVSGWMRLAMAEELQLVGAVFGTFGKYDMGMTAIAAGYDDKNKPKIVRFDFNPKLQPFGPGLTMLPLFDTKVTSVEVKGFECVSAGIDSIAKAVIAGTYVSNDPRILRFYAAREQTRLNALPLDALQQLAEAILAETKTNTVLVGGPDQIAIFPRRGKPKWLAPELRSSRQRVLSAVLWLGGPSNVRRADGQHYSMATSIFNDLTRPPTEQYTQVFVGGVVQDVDVALDGNIFAGCVFSNVTFKYKGGSFWFGSNNRLQQCEIEIEDGKVLPADSPLVSTCRVIPKAVVQIDPTTVGAPVSAKHVGCVIRTKNGSVKTKTTGKYKGKDCRGSHIEVRFVPIPSTRASRTAVNN